MSASRGRSVLVSSPIFDLGGDLVEGRLGRLGWTALPEGGAILGREPREQRVIRLVVEACHASAAVTIWGTPEQRVAPGEQTARYDAG